MEPEKRIINSQESWVISSDSVELGITELGGHMAPVTFYRNSEESIQPYYINPWADEALEIPEPVLRPLRGDFFCLPFGGDNKDGQKNHAAHGETSYAKWELSSYLKDADKTGLELVMQTKILGAKVTKRLSLKQGQNCIYTQHLIEGYEGRMPLGQHATLKVPKTEGAMRIASNPILFGMVNPTEEGYYSNGEYRSLRAGARFQNLGNVPTIWKDTPTTDCSSFPLREGFVDILQLFNAKTNTPAWTTAAIPTEGYLWFSLKDPKLLPSTVIWMENHGRHESPWNGRNRALGLEDVCSYFAAGLNDSVNENMINSEGIPTSVALSKNKATVVNYIEGVVRIPPSFDRVQTVSFAANSLSFYADSGDAVKAKVDYSFIESGEI